MSESSFADHVSVIAPLGQVLDGTPSPRTARVVAGKVRSQVTGAWRCPACGVETDVADEHAKHMTMEWTALTRLLTQVRDLLGPEPVDDEDRPVQISDPITTREASTILGVSDRHVRRLAQEGAVLALHIGKDWVFDLTSVTQLAAAREAVRA